MGTGVDTDSEHIHRVLAPNPGLMTGTGTNTYLVHDTAGSVGVVDPGPNLPVHLDRILADAASLGRVVAILVTHGHSDHLPAAYPLAEQTGAPIFGHALLPGVERPLADGERCVIGDVALHALETPGHTDDSLCYWLSEERALFTGDLIAGSGTVIVDEAPGGLAKYMRSLDRVLALDRPAVYPGHGPAVADGTAKIREYIAHRRAREQQVLAHLEESGAVEVEGLVSAMYPEVAPGLRGMAARNVRAILGKLTDEGHVAVDQHGTWVLGAMGPREFVRLQRQFIQGMAMRKKRNIEIAPIQEVKVRLLDYLEAMQPAPASEGFEGALAEAVLAVSGGGATGPAQAVASDLQMDWQMAQRTQGFRTWLRGAAAPDRPRG